MTSFEQPPKQRDWLAIVVLPMLVLLVGSGIGLATSLVSSSVSHSHELTDQARSNREQHYAAFLTAIETYSAAAKIYMSDRSLVTAALRNGDSEINGRPLREVAADLADARDQLISSTGDVRTTASLVYISGSPEIVNITKRLVALVLGNKRSINTDPLTRAIDEVSAKAGALAARLDDLERKLRKFQKQYSATQSTKATGDVLVSDGFDDLKNEFVRVAARDLGYLDLNWR